MGRGGIGVLLQQLAEFLQGTGVVLRPQAALRQQATQFRVGGVGLGCGLEKRYGVGKALFAVVAESQQGTRLVVARVGRKRGSKSAGGGGGGWGLGNVSGGEKAFFAVVAESQQGTRLVVARVGRKRGSKSRGGSGGVALLELRSEESRVGKEGRY